MEKHGIDISRWNKIVDYDTLAGCIDFAIIKAGGSDKGLYNDPTFIRNYNELHSRGVPLGAYYFVGRKFLTANDGIADAERFLDIIGERFAGEFHTTIAGESRIDFIYCTAPLYKRIIDAYVVNDYYTKDPVRDPKTNFHYPSDHLPILVDYEMK